MKKLLALFLALSMMLALCACGGKSEAAQAVDDAIVAIGEFSMSKEDDVRNARKMYDALSESDKASVENLAALEAAEAKLDLVYGFIDDLSVMTDYFTKYDFIHGMELLDKLEAQLAEMSEEDRALVLEVTSRDGEPITTALDALRTSAEGMSIHNTLYAQPGYVVSYPTNGGWIVNDRSDFSAYNVWLVNEGDVDKAIKEYREYISQFTTVSDSGSSFTFQDDEGKTVTVLNGGHGILQVRVAPFK